MQFKFLNSLLVSVGMIVAAPVAAAPTSAPVATSASKLSLAGARVGAPAKGEKLAGGASIIALAILGGIIAIGVFAATSDDGPSSN